MTIGERIKYLRKSLNLTQQQFANALDVDQGHIAGIEKGTKNPSKPLQKAICLTFYVRDIWLKTGEGEMFVSPQESIKRQVERFGAPVVLDAVLELLDQAARTGAGAPAPTPAQPPVEQGRGDIDAITIPSGAEAALENALKNLTARYDERAVLEAINNIIIKERGLVVPPIRQAHPAGTGDPRLDRLINTLCDIWAAGDENLKGWATIQFDRAFPDDVVEEVQKNKKLPRGKPPQVSLTVITSCHNINN